jgi:hypothetical protein
MTTGGDPGGLKSGETILEQLRRAAIRSKTAEQVWRDALETRDRLLVEAVDAGETVTKIATAGMVSRPRVIQVMARLG